MIRLKAPLSVWSLRIGLVLAAAIVIPACGGGASSPPPAPFSITTSSLASGVVGVPYTQTLQTVSASGAVTWSLVGGALPPGLALNPATGDVSGTPTGSASQSTIRVRALDPAGLVAEQALVITVTGGTPAALAQTSTSPLPSGEQNVFYNFGVSASGGAPPYTWAVTGGALPAGLTLNPANGGLTGVPTATGLFNFTLRVTDTGVGNVSQAYALTIAAPLLITTVTLADGTVGAAYNHSVVSTGGPAPVTYAVTSGTLPAGLVINPATGAITGTPTTAGTSSILVRVTDAAGVQQAVSLSITINVPPSVVTTTLPASTQGLAYNQTLTGTGGTVGYTWTVSAGALPTGLSLSTGGVITGTSTAAGPFGFTVLITDAAGGTGSRALSILINPAIVVTTSALSGWTVNRPSYSQTLAATGGTGALTFSITGGTLPAGLALNATTGVISGTPTAAGTSNFTVVATDTLGATGTKPLSIVINLAPTISTATLPDWTANFAYTPTAIAVTNGTAPFGYSVTVGALPAGMTLGAATGIVAGTPTTASSSTFTVRVLDAAGAATTRSYTVVINPAMAVTTTSPLPQWTQNFAGYSQLLAATGGTGAKTWSVGAGLPTGITLSAAGLLSGTPTAAPGTFNFTATVTDSVGATATKNFDLQINAPLAITTTSPIAAWTKDQAGYSVTLTATGGTGAKTWSNPGGGLPAGLTLSAAGVLSGTPTTAATTSFSVQVTDGVGSTAPAPVSLSITVNPPLAITSTSPLAAWTQNFAGYSQTLTATGGTGAKTWSNPGGGLPAGLALSSAGVISGNPTAAGTFAFNVQVSDTTTATAPTPVSLSITVNPPLAITSTSPLAPWTQNFAGYTQTLTATGGTGAKTWSNPGAGLPPGLSLAAATGVISGTPTTAGTFNFNVQVTDTTLATAPAPVNLTIVINAQLFTTLTSPQTIASWTKDQPGYSVTFTSTGGTGTKTWSVTAGVLPPGLSLSTGGVLSGTPTTAAVFPSFTLGVTDGIGSTSNPLICLITINPPLAITTTSPIAPWTVNQAGYNQALTATGGTGTKTWSQTGGALPAGLTLNSSGSITGQPTATGTFSVSVQVTDATTATAPAPVALSITINPVPSVTSTSPLAQRTQGLAGYSVTLTATGGTGALTWSNPGGGMPTGLTLAPGTGLISGTPTAAGTFNFNVRVTDTTTAQSALAAMTIVINPPVSITSTTPLAPYTKDVAGYSVTLTATGGTGALTWSNPSGTLPAGLTLAPATGVISGTPTAAGTSTFTVQATDTLGATAPAPVSLSITINLPPSITSTSPLPQYTKDRAGYSVTVNATGGTGARTWSLANSTTLPTGLSLAAATGVISGTPTVANTFFFDLQVKDSLNSTSSIVTFSITINPPVAITSTSPLATWTRNLAGYSQTLTGTGGTAGLTWSITSGSFPSSLTFGPTGTITGTPTDAPGTYTFFVQATDVVGATAPAPVSLSITINPPLSITTGSLANWTQFQSGYSQTLAATGGTGAKTWNFTSGSLPVGLSLAPSTGVISGTPTGGPSTYTVFAQVTDSLGANAGAPVSLSMTLNGPLNFSGPTTLPAWTTGQSGYSATSNVTGGTGTKTWSNPSGTMPSGLTLNTATGAITGTPGGAPGVYTFDLRVVDVTTASTQLTFSITINPAVSISTGSTLPDGGQNLFYSVNFLASGGTSPYTWSSTTLPPLVPGMALASTGQFSGTPLSGGSYSFQVQVTDAAGSVATIPTVNFFVLAPLTVTTTTLPGATANAAYAAAPMAASGGRLPYTWSVLSGSLPPGITLSGAGAWGGTAPGSDGTAGFVLKVTDADNRIATKALSITVTGGAPTPLAILTASLPPATQGSFYQAGLTGIGGTPGTYNWTINSGSLPAGLVLAPSTGIISGTPSAVAGSFDIKLDDGSTNVTASLSITVNGPLSVDPTPLAAWTVSRPSYPGALAPIGGTSPYSWSATGALPTGLTLNSNGSFSGTPTVSGPFSFTAQVSDSAGAVASGTVAITINPLPQIQNNFLPAATQGTPYPVFSMTVLPFTGTGPFTFTSAPNPPAAGLTLAGGGSITGTPTTSGSGSVSFTVTDAAGATANTSLNLTINLPPSITNVTLPDGTPGVSYPSQQINTLDGTPGFSFTISVGSLPPGLSLSLGGQITGTPSTNGVYPFTVKATDAVGAFATKALSITITSGPTVNFQSVTEGQSGVSRGVNVTLGFNMAMNQSTFTSGAGGTVTLSPDPSGGTVPTPILFYWTSPTQVTLVFDTVLPAGIHGDDLLDPATPYLLTLTTGVTSTPGTGSQPLGSTFTLNFTTQSQLPNPTYTMTPDLSLPVTVGEDTVVLTWDQPMDQTRGSIQVKNNFGYKATGTLGIGGVLNAGQSQGVTSMSWDVSGQVLTMVLSTGVPANSLFRFSVSEFNALSGAYYNQNNDLVFVTPGPTGTAPQPTGMLPLSGSTASRDTQIILGFTAPMMPADLLDPSKITVTGTGVGSVTINRELVDFSGVFLTPVGPWPAATTITVTVKGTVQNAAGVAIGSDTVYTFTTEAADTTAMVIDAPFSTLANGTTDIDPYQFSAAFAFTRSGGLRAFVNGATMSPKDVSIVEHNAPNIPVKGYTLFSNNGGLEVRSDYGWNGLQFSTQYDLTLNPTLESSYGGVISVAASANVLGFTTRANSGLPTAARPVFFGGGGDTKYNTTGSGGVKVELRTDVQSTTGATLTVTGTDSPDAAFSKPLSASGSSSFRYTSESDNGDNPEAALTTPGNHVVTYSATDTVHTVSLSAKVFAFNSSLYPSLATPADSNTPTLSWAAVSPTLGADGMAVAILSSSGNPVYIAILPTNATTFTLPVDQQLPTGTYTFALHFFHLIDGTFKGASSEADTNPSVPFNAP